MSTYDDASLIYYPSGYKEDKIYSLKPTDGSGDLTFTRASTATRVNESGLIESVATGVPRIDYTSGCGKLLLEPQRTNSLFYSEQFDNAAWTKGAVSVTANNAVSPDGYTNADLITADGTTTQHYVFQFQSAAARTYSIFLKMGTQRYVQILTSGATTLPVANYDLQNGVANMVGSSSTASIENYGNGWYRCILSTTDAAAASFYVLFASSMTSVRYEVNNSSGTIWAYGAQAELGSYATSYLPTTSTAVTRLADAMIVDDVYTNNLVTASGGTWYIEIDNNFAYTRDGSQVGIFIANDTSGGVTTDGLALRNNGAAARLIVNKRISGVQTPIYNTTTDHVKVAIKWNGTTADVFENGVKVVNSTAFTPTIMEYFGSFGGDVPKYIVESLLFPTALSDDELIALTTI